MSISDVRMLVNNCSNCDSLVTSVAAFRPDLTRRSSTQHTFFHIPHTAGSSQVKTAGRRMMCPTWCRRAPQCHILSIDVVPASSQRPTAPLLSRQHRPCRRVFLPCVINDVIGCP